MALRARKRLDIAMTRSRTSPRGRRLAFRVGLFLMAAGFASASVPAGGYVFIPTTKEAELYRLIREDPQQERAGVVLDPRLSRAARLHAEDTQRRKFFGHVNPDGKNANRRALDEGYPLPALYVAAQNYIESMAGSVVDTPADAVALWRTSPPHATHLFGQSDFYRGQVVVGVGHAPPDRWGYGTYVFLSAPLPVGQNGSPAAPIVPRLEVMASGEVFLTRTPPESILEVWSASPALSISPWKLDRAVVADAAGRFSVGPRSGPARFFRLHYFRP
jgi:hypothetical protein